MTIEELYKWAIENGAKNYEIVLSERDNESGQVNPQIRKTYYSDGDKDCQVVL